MLEKFHKSESISLNPHWKIHHMCINIDINISIFLHQIKKKTGKSLMVCTGYSL